MARWRRRRRGAIAHLLDCIETGMAFETNPADNLRTLTLAEAAYDEATVVDASDRMRHGRTAEQRRNG